MPDKKIFISVYCYTYGATKKAALAAWKNTSTDYKRELIRGYYEECKKNFYND